MPIGTTDPCGKGRNRQLKGSRVQRSRLHEAKDSSSRHFGDVLPSIIIFFCWKWYQWYLLF